MRRFHLLLGLDEMADDTVEAIGVSVPALEHEQHRT
jgi:hypothetical protein